MNNIERVCSVCGRKYLVNQAVIQRDKHMTCSSGCTRARHHSDNGRMFHPKTGERVYFNAMRKGCVERICEICGKLYMADMWNVDKGYGKVCGRDCAFVLRQRDLGVRPGVMVNCKICGKEFKTILAKIEDGRGKYCSRDCQSKGITKQTTPLTCTHCGKIEHRKPWKLRQIESGYIEKFFCSHECRYAHQKDGSMEPCSLCGKLFYRQKGNEHRKFCSRECTFKVLRGKNHHLYKEEKTHRDGEEFFPADRNEIFKRYRYRCAVTGLTMSEALLHIHHIIPISKGGTSDPDNGIPLCVPIHRKVHQGLIDLTPYVIIKNTDASSMPSLT